MNFSFLSSSTKAAANSIAEILADFQDKVDALLALAEDKTSQAEVLNSQAAELIAQSKDANDEASKALNAANKIKSFLAD